MDEDPDDALFDIAVHSCREGGRTGIRLAKILYESRTKRFSHSDPRWLEAAGLMCQVVQRHDMALEMFVDALSSRRNELGPRHLDVGRSYHILGSYHHSKNDLENAEKGYRLALEIRVATLVSDHPKIAESYQCLGEICAARGTFEEAKAWFKRALAIQETNKDVKLVDKLRSLGFLADLHRSNGDVDTAMSYLQLSVQMNENADGMERINSIRPLKELIDYHKGLRNFAEATRLGEQAVSILQHVEGFEAVTALALAQLAEVKTADRRQQEAVVLYERAAEIITKQTDVEDRDRARILGGLGGAYVKLKRYQKAKEVFERVLLVVPRLGDSLDAATLIKNAAVAYQLAGHHSEGRQLSTRALALRERLLGPDDPDVADALITLSRACRGQGAEAEARTLLLRALRIMEGAFGESDPRLADVWSRLAILHSDDHNQTEATSCAERAIEIFEPIDGNYSTMIGALNTLAISHIQLDQMERAEEMMRQALELSGGTDDILLNNLAFVAAKLGQYDRAVALAEQVVAMREETLGSAHPETIDALSNLTSDVWASGNIPRTRSIFQRTTSLRAEYLSTSLRSLSEAGMRALLSKHGAESQALVSFHADWDCDNQDTLELALTRTLNEKCRIVAELRSSGEDISVDVIQRNIPQGSIVIEFVEYIAFDPGSIRGNADDRRYCAYILQHDKKPEFAALGAADRIDDAIASVMACGTRQVICPRHGRDSLRKLDELLLAPIRRRFGHVEHYLISPTSSLHAVPFAALIDEDGRYVVERTLITYLVSARDLLSRERQSPSQSKPVVLAAPDYGGLYVPLPGAEGEAKAIKRTFGLFGGVKSYVGAAATKDRFLSVRGPMFLHVGTHGFFRATKRRAKPMLHVSTGAERDLISCDDDLLSERVHIEDALDDAGLVFSGTSESDMLATAREIATMNLRGTRMVVLSACETGVGEFSRSEGVYGLRRALALAGAETQVVSLWKVADDAARALMTRFYKELKEGAGRGESLRIAQLALLAIPQFSTPYHWASFVMIGDERPLKLAVRG